MEKVVGWVASIGYSRRRRNICHRRHLFLLVRRVVGFQPSTSNAHKLLAKFEQRYWMRPFFPASIHTEIHACTGFCPEGQRFRHTVEASNVEVEQDHLKISFRRATSGCHCLDIGFHEGANDTFELRLFCLAEGLRGNAALRYAEHCTTVHLSHNHTSTYLRSVLEKELRGILRFLCSSHARRQGHHSRLLARSGSPAPRQKARASAWLAKP